MDTHDIKQTICSAIPDAEVYVQDPHGDGQHFEAFVISAVFDDLPIIKQHRLVMGALKEAFKESVHALALKTFTREKWLADKGSYGF